MAHPASWSSIPTALLHAELARRHEPVQNGTERPACGSGIKGDYNLSLHVGALFLILIISTAACSFPVIVRRFPRFPVPHQLLFLSRHFGTGVLIATAFVHLLPTAFESLTDQCLPSFWNEGYPPMPGLIAMVAVFVVVGIEMFFATRGAGHMHGSELDALPAEEGRNQRKTAKNSQIDPHRPRSDSWRPYRQIDSVLSGQDQSISLGMTMDSPTINDKSSSGANTSVPNSKKSTAGEDGEDSDLDLDELEPPRDTADLLQNGHANTGNHTQTRLNEIQSQQRLLLQCLLLEAGILFHSIFIGIALSVATGTSFIVLLIAITFHQTFEGLALGSRIAGITSFSPRSPKPWLMCLAYGTTTPIGQAIGLGVHNLYDPEGQMGLLMVGVMNAISSGLLLFAGLVELLAEDFLSDRSYETLSGRKRLEACAAVFLGAMLMALVGAWA